MKKLFSRRRTCDIINVEMQKERKYMETIKFDDLELDAAILRAVKEMGFEEATAIQSQAIPVALAGQDVIGQAQTGTGKTAAFGIPVLQKIDPKVKKPQAIILCPTRELAIQVAEEMRKLAMFTHGIKVLPIYGGQEIVKQIRSLKSGVQVIIGTPGRVMDHMRRKTVKLDCVHTVTLDEADEMLNMGFLEDMETILSQLPEDRQTLLFSATMSKEILQIAEKYQKNAVSVKVVKKELTVPNIEQYYYEVRPKNKEEVLSRLLDLYSPKLSLVFCNTKKQVDELVTALQGRGYFADGLHGDLKQAQRDHVMNNFKNGKTDILVATDVAARGIDVDGVEAVFNYDIPQDEEYYVHRIGRTGRAGRLGKSFSFVVGKEIYKLKDIERYCKTKLKLQPIPSANDITQIRVDKVFEEVRTLLQEDDLKNMKKVVEARINEEELTAFELSAALLKLFLGDEPETIEELTRKERGYSDRGDSTRGNSERRRSNKNMERLFINVGRNNRIKPGDVLGAIAGECRINGDLIGNIDMYDKFTFVDVPKELSKRILRTMNQSKIKGKKISVEIASKR